MSFFDIDKDKCYEGGNRHNFQPRYSEQPDTTMRNLEAKGHNIRELLYHNVYEKDICVWCGKEIKK